MGCSRINVKLGGTNFVPNPEAIKWIRGGDPLMVIGVFQVLQLPFCF